MGNYHSVPAVLIRQQEENDCAVCCLAMLTGRTHGYIKDQIGDAYRPEIGTPKLSVALDRLGFTRANNENHGIGDYLFVARCSGSDPLVLRDQAWGRRALMIVPSLNYSNRTHVVYWYGNRVLDPSNLRTYQRWGQLVPFSMFLFREVFD